MSSSVILSVFQSAPLAEARGDSISCTDTDKHTRFQSAPLAEARGDVRREGFCESRLSGFNPLPLPKQGEMLVAVTSKCSAGYTGRYAIQSNSG